MKDRLNPCLWFDGQAQAAADFYASAFPDAKKLGGNAMVATVEVGGLKLTLLDGGPQFKINPSISFFYHCASEAEIDSLWAKLAGGGSVLMGLDAYPFAKRYGWLADKYGVNWQLMLPESPPAQKAFPSLMFTGSLAGRAEEAIRFYASVFKDSSVGMLSRYGPGQAPDKEGTLNFGAFTLGGRSFSAMDSAHPHAFTFSEAVSLVVTCEDQAEIDYYWKRLGEGGSDGQCGWLKDKFGLSWQVVPKVLESLMSDPERSGRVVQAFLKMKKFDIAALMEA